MMPEEKRLLPPVIQSFLDDFEAYDNSFTIKGIDLGKGEERIRLSLHRELEEHSDRITEDWEILLHDFRDCRLITSQSNTLDILTDHPVLWMYNDKQASMYYKGRCPEPDMLRADLYRLYHTLFGDLLLSHDPLHPANLEVSLSYSPGYGHLGSGPVPQLEAYAACLEARGIACSIVGEHRSFWGLPPGDSRRLKMLILGDSYFIASRVEFRQLR